MLTDVEKTGFISVLSTESGEKAHKQPVCSPGSNSHNRIAKLP